MITRRLTIWATAWPKTKSIPSVITAATPSASSVCRHGSSSSSLPTAGFPFNRPSHPHVDPGTFCTELTCWRRSECNLAYMFTVQTSPVSIQKKKCASGVNILSEPVPTTFKYLGFYRESAGIINS